MNDAEFNRRMREAANRVVDAHEAWLAGMAPYFADAVAGERPEKALTDDAVADLDRLYREYRDAQEASQRLWLDRVKNSQD